MALSKIFGYKRELFSINMKLQIQGNIKMGKLSPKLFNQLTVY